jgi:hypothetical protein
MNDSLLLNATTEWFNGSTMYQGLTEVLNSRVINSANSPHLTPISFFHASMPCFNYMRLSLYYTLDKFVYFPINCWPPTKLKSGTTSIFVNGLAKTYHINGSLENNDVDYVRNQGFEKF